MPASLPSESHPLHLCYTKNAWSGSWVERPLLEALTITDQVAPGHSSAVLKYRYGVGMLPEIGSRAADSSLTSIPRASLVGHYVQIDVDGLGIWYGIITDVADDRQGLIDGTYASGTELYTAFGLTWLLDQSPAVTQSKVVSHTGGTWTIDRALPFNGGTGGKRNSSAVSWKNYHYSSKVFTDGIVSNLSLRAWTAANAIEYLFEHFSPKDSSGSELVPFALDASALSFLDYELPLTDYHGQTVWHILNRLIDRHRGLGWHAYINSGAVTIYVWSQHATSTSLPSGGSIPANTNTTTLNFDNSVNVRQANVTTTLLTYFDQVVCLGERAGTVFTARPQSNMEPDWTTAEQTEYNDGAKYKTGWSTLQDADKEAANMDVRASDKLAKVYSWWRLRKAWNGRGDTDPTSGTHKYAFGQIDSDGEIHADSPAQYFRAGLRIEPFLPLRQSIDYSSGTITPDTDNTDDRESDFLPPILLFRAPSIRSGAGVNDSGWIHCERLNQSTDAGSTKRAYDYSVDLSITDDGPGLIMRTVGAPQHYIAAERFVATGTYEDIPTAQKLNHNSWLATIYVLQDNFCRAQWPLQSSLPTLDIVRQLVLKIPGAHFDVILPGTIVGVDAGELKKTTLGGILRDDRDRLKDLARLAFAWYGQERRILSLSFRGLDTPFSIGTLVTTIGSGAHLLTINTVITSVTYDLRNGTTALSTSFGELDFAAAV